MIFVKFNFINCNLSVILVDTGLIVMLGRSICDLLQPFLVIIHMSKIMNIIQVGEYIVTCFSRLSILLAVSNQCRLFLVFLEISFQAFFHH